MADTAFGPMESKRVAVVMERRPSDHPWRDHVWRCVEVLEGDPDQKGHLRLVEEGDILRILCQPVELGLHRKETHGYMLNLAQPEPKVFLALREAEPEDGELEMVPMKATACPFDAEAYTEGGAEMVDGVSMPQSIRQWVSDFVDAHHQEEKFVKRRRGPKDGGHEPFDRPIPVNRPGRAQ